MKLHSPTFERRLRRSVKQTVRRSPALKREARRTNRSRHFSGGSYFRLVISGLAAALTWRIAASTGHPTTALVFVGIWLLAWLSLQVQSLAHHLFASPDLGALSLLPIAGRLVFRWQLQKFLWAASWLLVDLLAMLLALAWFTEVPVAKWPAVIPIAALAWLVTLALTGLAMVHCPRLPYPLITAVVMVGGFVVLTVHSYVGPALLAALDRSADSLRLLLPTAWPLSLFQLLRADASWIEGLFLIPSAALIWTLRQTHSRLTDNYEFSEPVRTEAADILPEDLASSLHSTANAPLRVGLTTIEEHVQSRGFLATAPWPAKGWFEARLWQWFTRRERALAEFAFPQAVELTKPWKKVFLHLAIGLVAGFVLGWVNPAWKFWILSAAITIPAFRVLACYYANGSAFRPMFCSGVNIQMYAPYPVGYRELSRVLFKYSLIQLPLLVGFLTICGALVAHLANWGLALGAIIGFKAAFLLAAVRLIFVTLAFSSGTNDSTRLRFRTVILIGVVLAMGALFLGLGAAGLLVSHQLAAVGFWLGAIVDAWCFWRIYGWFYDANQFDIMNLPRQQP